MAPEGAVAGAGTTEADAAAVAAKATADAAAAKATADAKAVTDKATADAATAAAAAAPKAPEKYELTVAEAGKAHLDAGDLAAIEKVARDNDWTNQEAQDLVNEQVEASAALALRYFETTKADAEYGGDKLAATQQLARAAVDRIRPQGHARREAFMSFINRAGAGNHIEVVSFLADLGKLMAEDSPAQGRIGSSPSGQTVEEKLYPTTPNTPSS